MKTPSGIVLLDFALIACPQTCPRTEGTHTPPESPFSPHFGTSRGAVRKLVPCVCFSFFFDLEYFFFVRVLMRPAADDVGFDPFAPKSLSGKEVVLRQGVLLHPAVFVYQVYDMDQIVRRTL